MTPFNGVRISWLMLARNSLLARLAASASSRARSSSASAVRLAVIFCIAPTSRSGLPSSSTKYSDVVKAQTTLPSLRLTRCSTPYGSPVSI